MGASRNCTAPSFMGEVEADTLGKGTTTLTQRLIAYLPMALHDIIPSATLCRCRGALSEIIGCSAPAAVYVACSPLCRWARLQPGLFGSERDTAVVEHKTWYAHSAGLFDRVENSIVVAQFQKCFEGFYMFADVDYLISVVAYYLPFYISTVGAGLHAIYFYHGYMFLSLFGRGICQMSKDTKNGAKTTLRTI